MGGVLTGEDARVVGAQGEQGEQVEPAPSPPSRFRRAFDLTLGRLVGTLIALCVVALCGLALLMLSEFRDRFSSTRVAQAEAAIHAALALLEHIDDDVETGAASIEAAQADALGVLREFRFADGEGYIAILYDDFVNVMHPVHAKHDGANHRDMQDADGRYIAREAVEIGRRGGVGLNRYRFENPQTGRDDVKTSAIARFDAWGWTLVAGVFDRRVDQTIIEMTTFVVLYLIAVIAVFLFLSLQIARCIVLPIRTLTLAMRRIAGGDLKTEIPYTTANNECGQMAAALSVFRDNALRLVDVKMDLEDSLRQEKELTMQQRQFVSMVSHEIRTPLSIIDGAAGALQRRREKMTEVKVAHYIETIRRSVSRLVRLMESTLTASKLEAGTFGLKRVNFDIREMLKNIVEERRALSRNATVSLHDEGLPSSICVDDRVMYNVFDNLISNAIKYGGAEPAVEVRGWTEGAHVAISVRDYGIGIPAHELDRIGQRYFRASSADGIAGTGIGLHLVTLVAELHGGRLDVESELGVGSTFTVRLLSTSPAFDLETCCSD